MVAITLLGETIEVAPYKLKQLRRAAPLIEKVNATLGSLSTLSGGIEVMDSLTAFVAIGAEKVRADFTFAALEDKIGMEDMPALQNAFRDILTASGFKAGEAKAPAGTEATGGASTISSDASASALPQPA
jgi:hypothetical protein